MKRSRKASLVMMGTVPCLLAACENSERVLVYRSLEECAAAGILSSQQCYAEFSKARYESERVAPRYRRVEDCQADFGSQQCQPNGSHFIPLMRGVLVKDPRPAPEDEEGSSTGGGSAGGGRYFVTQPLYESRDDKGMLRTADNRNVSRLSGAYDVKSSLLDAKPSAKLVSRGGFGRAAAARAGG